MYDTNSITALSNTVGFGTSVKANVNLDAANSVGSSGMMFNSYHKLVTVDNMLATFKEEISKYSAKVNSELLQIRTDAAKRVLVDVLDSHIDFDDSVDYSSIITTKLNLLRRPFGFAVAITCLELMMSSGRFNVEERTIRQTYAYLKLELEGAKNERGHRVSSGITGKYWGSVKAARKVIFQIKPEVQDGGNW